jgi:hypothetical protein
MMSRKIMNTMATAVSSDSVSTSTSSPTTTTTRKTKQTSIGNRRIKYKKAPQAPRRFKSSYIFFSTIKHKSIRVELLKANQDNAKVR